MSTSPASQAASISRPSTFKPSAIFEPIPGLALTFAVAGVGFALSRLPFLSTLSPLILSILIGMAFHNIVGTPAICRPGVKFSLRRILRLAIILLGLQLTVSQVLAVGGTGLFVVVATLAVTFGFTVWLGARLGVDPKLSQLIAAGTSICGASAVIAANTATEGSDEDVAYAVACVTVFGSISMFVYPLLPHILGLSTHSFGLWAGASIHEIAQVVAAAFQHGKDAGDLATISKLARVMMLAPVVLLLGFVKNWSQRKGAASGQAVRARAPAPWFVFGFIALIGFNSFDLLPHPFRSELIQINVFLLSAALAAMGLETDFRKLKAKGLRPLALGAGAWIFIALFSLGLIKVLAA